MSEIDEAKERVAKLLEATIGSTSLATRPGADLQVVSYYDQALKLQQYAEARVIATVEDNQAATDDLVVISNVKKAMEGKRKEYLDPLNAQLAAIRETYTLLMSPILEADKITRDKMMAYRQEQERIRAAEEEINRKRMEAAQEEMNLKGELSESLNLVEVTPEPAKEVKTEMGSAGQRDNWKYKIVDLALLPREYLVPDTAMLNAIAKKHHDQKEIPGVRFYNEPVMIVKAR